MSTPIHDLRGHYSMVGLGTEPDTVRLTCACGFTGPDHPSGTRVSDLLKDGRGHTPTLSKAELEALVGQSSA